MGEVEVNSKNTQIIRIRNVAATLKQNEINRWFEDQQRLFLSIAQLPIVQSQSRMLLDPKTNQSDRTAAYASLLKYLTSIDADRGSFTEVSILDRSDHIIASTRTALEGKYESSADVTYFEEVKPGQPAYIEDLGNFRRRVYRV